MTIQTLGILVLLLVCACKPGDKSDDGSTVSAPQRVGGEGDAAPAVKVGVLGQGGGKRLTLDLQRPPAGSESARLWTCWSLPADDFALGRAVCKEDAKKTVEITTANVDVSCISNPDFGVVKAKRPVSTDFCGSYDVFAYRFEPAFNVKVED